MKVFLLVACLVAFAKAASIEKTGATWRIINGEDAKPGEFPFQVSLQKPSGSHFCGGSLLNEKFVITAAHCVEERSPENVTVVAGTIDLEEAKLRRTVEKIIIHEKYDWLWNWFNDIALLKLQDEFVMTEMLGFVQLPNPHQFIAAGSVATVSGWGRLSVGGIRPNVLQKAQIQIADQDVCREAYSPAPVHDTQICAYDPNEERGPCKGDSGGPLTVNKKLVGIVSWSRSCALTTHPAVFTRVTDYLDWIDSHVS